jgi:hypothetical protein
MRSTRFGLGWQVAGLIVLTLVGAASAQTQTEVSRQLRVEWEVLDEPCCPPRLAGHIYNDSAYRIGSVRMRVETLDASDKVVNETLAWIYVNVPARGRASFSLRRPAREQKFRLSVESFVLIAHEPAPEGP